MSGTGAKTRYLFIRLLEACNAKCFMCGFAGLRDDYRFSLAEFSDILPQARALGVEIIRFTGGEPLLHRDLPALVAAGTAAGMKMSVITNGYLLTRKLDALSRAGLAQVIVSLDGATAESHDRFRHTPDLFRRAVAGLEMARDLGILTRVNTVAGPHNYTELPALQRQLTQWGVGQWELSAIKQDLRVRYPDPDHVRAVCDPIYRTDPSATLVPIGKRFYGNTAVEQSLYFDAGIPPRPSQPHCLVAGNALYLDGKAGLGFACSLLPHRNAGESGGGVKMRTERGWMLDRPEFTDHASVFRAAGPSRCKGCSSSAAGYSDAVAALGAHAVDPWYF